MALIQAVTVVTVLVLAGTGGAFASYYGSDAGALRGAELQANQLQVHMLQQETAITDYAVEANPSNVPPYELARTATSAALGVVRSGTAGATHPGLVASVASSVASWERWAEETRQQVLSTGPVSLQSPGFGLGGRLFEAFQAALAALTSRLESDFQFTLNLATGTGVAVEVGALFGDVLVVLVMVLLLRRMYRLALKPLGDLAGAADTIAAGGQAQIPHVGRTDEIGALTQALRNWQEASREHEVLVTQAPVGICRLDVQGRLQTANQRLGDMLGRAPDDLRGCLVQELFDSEELASRLRRWASGEGYGEDRLEVVARAVDVEGPPIWCSLTLGPMRSPDGGHEGSEAIVEDVTEQRRQTDRAARIQRELWPRTKPGLDDYQVAGACRPAQDVAGDLYDWLEWPDGRLDLTVADVMGKGIGAALVMASLRAALRAAAQSLGPAERLQLAADSITLGSDDEGLFVTVFHCRLEPWSGDLRFVDAGHGYCAVRRASGELVPLGQRSLPVGVRSGERFREGRITLGPGDMLVAYSDGLVERSEGTVGLEAFADELGRAEDADDAVRRLLERTQVPAADDVTVLVLRRLQPASVPPTISSSAPIPDSREPVMAGRAGAAAPDAEDAAGRRSSVQTPVLHIRGRLDAGSDAEVRLHMRELVRSGATNLVLDLSELISIDSSGLGAVISGLKLVRQVGGDLRIALPNQQVKTTLRLTSLDRVLPPYASIDEAVAGLQPEEVDITLGVDGDARTQLDVVHQTLARFLDQLAEPPPDEWRMLFELAVAEIAANIIEHSRPQAIHLEVTARGGRVAAGFTDTGQGWSSPSGPAAVVDELVERGRGLSLARTAVDELAYERRGDTNHWRLTKRLVGRG